MKYPVIKLLHPLLLHVALSSSLLSRSSSTPSSFPERRLSLSLFFNSVNSLERRQTRLDGLSLFQRRQAL